ncbi:hypothetical protein [Ectobacillus antri]|uniref:hypothetical protein n=1 Tax=Ectobacillus antri TaxID=2486280 RepID=UPI000F5B7A2E|nr:hypothetical protein [Ectobacillus antri]
MKERLLSFIEYVNAQDYVGPLLPLQEIKVRVDMGNEACTLHISKTGLHISEASDVSDCLQFSHEDDLRSLTTGIRLQMLVRMKGATYKGTYRTLLLLESLFYLYRPAA